MTTHTYGSSLRWTGRTDDYETYSRRHHVTVAGTTAALSAAAAWGSEQLIHLESSL